MHIRMHGSAMNVYTYICVHVYMCTCVKCVHVYVCMQKARQRADDTQAARFLEKHARSHGIPNPPSFSHSHRNLHAYLVPALRPAVTHPPRSLPPAPRPQYKEWTAKYGYGRFFPMYVDKSGRNDEPTSSAAPKVAAVSQAFRFGRGV